MEAELGFQTKKLHYLEALGEVFELSSDPRGIFDIANSIVETKASEVFLSLGQMHCLEEYHDFGEVFAAKAKILRILKAKQVKAEER